MSRRRTGPKAWESTAFYAGKQARPQVVVASADVAPDTVLIGGDEYRVISGLGEGIIGIASLPQVDARQAVREKLAAQVQAQMDRLLEMQSAAFLIGAKVVEPAQPEPGKVILTDRSESWRLEDGLWLPPMRVAGVDAIRIDLNDPALWDPFYQTAPPPKPKPIPVSSQSGFQGISMLQLLSWNYPKWSPSGWLKGPFATPPLAPGYKFFGFFEDDEPIPTEPVPQRQQTGAIVAKRLWRVSKERDGTIRLMSAGVDAWWEGPTLTADEKPVAYGRHGVHGFTAGEQREWGQYRDTSVVYGIVRLWGRVVAYERGYRAEHASILRLGLRPGLWGQRSHCTCFLCLSGAMNNDLGRSVLQPTPGVVHDMEVAQALERRYGCDVDLLRYDEEIDHWLDTPEANHG
jgi:hypothetical protein